MYIKLNFNSKQLILAHSYMSLNISEIPLALFSIIEYYLHSSAVLSIYELLFPFQSARGWILPIFPHSVRKYTQQSEIKDA
jgi:hypothetical protein